MYYRTDRNRFTERKARQGGRSEDDGAIGDRARENRTGEDGGDRSSRSCSFYPCRSSRRGSTTFSGPEEEEAREPRVQGLWEQSQEEEVCGGRRLVTEPRKRSPRVCWPKCRFEPRRAPKIVTKTHSQIYARSENQAKPPRRTGAAEGDARSSYEEQEEEASEECREQESSQGWSGYG